MATINGLSVAYQTAKNLAATLDALGRSLPLSQSQALQVRSSVYLISAILAPRITTTVDVALIGQTIAEAAATIATDVLPTDGAPAFATAAASAALAAPIFASPALTRAGALGRMLAECAEATFLGQSFVAEAKSDFADRQSAIAARARIANAMEAATDRIAAATGRDVIGLLSQVALTAADHVAAVAADLRPLIQAETLRSAPSTALAFELYGDPSRAEELVTRNRCGTPLFMPTKITALAPNT